MSCALALLTALMLPQESRPLERPRARDLGLVIGRLPPGPRDAITDVAGVRVGHATLVQGDDVRTGVTVVLPHGGNPFAEKVPCAIAVQNGFGKLAGSTQVDELGTLESPIALTNTLAVGTVADALVGWLLALPGNERVRSVNVVVGETNDGRVNDIRKRPVQASHVAQALADCREEVAEGSIGAGTGTTCLGFKGGIGTASRRTQNYTVGVLVQSNFGGALSLHGRPLAGEAAPARPTGRDREDGSCMIVIATDAPLCARNLRRLATRAFAGMARTGASFANGSGDYAIAFSTAESLRVRAGSEPLVGGGVLRNEAMDPLFEAVADATEEAIWNSLLQATDVQSRTGSARALPVDRVRAALRASGR
jgi:D-aminopeptidase